MAWPRLEHRSPWRGTSRSPSRLVTAGATSLAVKAENAKHLKEFEHENSNALAPIIHAGH